MLKKMDCYDFMKSIEDEKYDLILADPPYNNCVENEWDNQWQNDDEYLKWLEIRIIEFARLLKPSGNLILYCKRQFHHHIKLILDKYLTEQRSIIWVRRRMMDMTRGKTLASGYEPILWYSKSDSYFYNSGNAKVPPQKHLSHRSEYKKGGRLEKGVGLTDAWVDISALPHNSKEKTIHPTQKPLKICNRIVKIFSPEQGCVFIPFGGSGSEILACINYNLDWNATEINDDYYYLIKSRIEDALKNITK
ncbi:site-specific DNA-methyltransferase [Candidatus Lokiarchaeum ossiferum]|uniref:site-specific DNA-methyltransferase n=1 Tax=Candidatus Lokiarchaeum ossiferum TaxID=2951803 RepID=UPI00352DD9E2